MYSSPCSMMNRTYNYSSLLSKSNLKLIPFSQFKASLSHSVVISQLQGGTGFTATRVKRAFDRMTSLGGTPRKTLEAANTRDKTVNKTE